MGSVTFIARPPAVSRAWRTSPPPPQPAHQPGDEATKPKQGRCHRLRAVRRCPNHAADRIDRLVGQTVGRLADAPSPDVNSVPVGGPREADFGYAPLPSVLSKMIGLSPETEPNIACVPSEADPVQTYPL